MPANPNDTKAAARRASLCEACAFVRLVEGRHGQRYLLCRNQSIAAKYPPQPVLSCPGYESG